MSFPYKPPRHLARLATVVNAVRTQVGWGIHEDGSVGLEHIMSANPFAGKAKSWGIANIDDNGDIQIISKGPGNDTMIKELPEDLVQQIVQFYEREGLNVRNIHEADPTKESHELENYGIIKEVESLENNMEEKSGNLYAVHSYLEKGNWIRAEQWLNWNLPKVSEDDLAGAQFLYVVLPDDRVLVSPTTQHGYHAEMLEDNLSDEELDSVLGQPGMVQGTVENGYVIIGNAPTRKDVLRTLRLVVPKLKEAGAELNGYYTWARSGAGGVRRINQPIPQNFLASRVAEIENGMKACPHCGENDELYTHPTLSKFECGNCGTIGELDDLIDFGEDPDPDRNNFTNDDPDYDGGAVTDDWKDYESKMKEAGAGFSFQGAPASGDAPASGIAVRTDRGASREEIEQTVGGLEPTPSHELQKDYVDKMNEGQGTSFPSSDNPFVNRGGSYLAENIEDHFFETQKEAAPPQVGTPGGLGDTRNFGPGNQPGFIVVSQYLTPDDNWLFLSPKCKGIVVETGGLTSHGAVEARKMGIVAIVQAEGAKQINAGDTVTADPTTGRVDVNGGGGDFEMGDVMKARRELVRFVWSKGQAVFSQVTQPLTAELAEEEYQPGQSDRSHRAMSEYMEDHDMLDWEDSSIGVIYDDGTAEYYEKISDQPALENWLHSNFPSLVKNVVYKAVEGGIYQPVAAADAEDNSKAPVCPECGSHSYTVVVFPQETNGEGLLRCLNDGTEYPWTLYMNPKSSTMDALQGSGECDNCGHGAYEHNGPSDSCQHEGCGCNRFEVGRRRSSFEKLAPGKEHMKGVSPKRNRQYEDIFESCKKSHPDWEEDRCKELAARTVNKQREEKGETKDSRTGGTEILADGTEVLNEYKQDYKGGDRVETPWGYGTVDSDNDDTGMWRVQFDTPSEYGESDVLSSDELRLVLNSKQVADGKYSPGTRVELQHNNLRGKGTILEHGGHNDALDEDHYVIQLDSGDKVEDIPESAFKKIKSAGSETVAVNDTDGNPIKIGELYLMHSTQYKIPDVIRITNINEHQIEAHIDSDVKGMFPIEIDPREFVNLGYSFEPYATAKTAIAGPTDQLLYTAVKSALSTMSLGGSNELVHDPQVNEAVQKALNHFGDPESALAALNDADSFGNFMRYYSHKMAARALHISPKRQKELINEGIGSRARNFEKLNLDGTHYQSTYDLIPHASDDDLADHFLW